LNNRRTIVLFAVVVQTFCLVAQHAIPFDRILEVYASTKSMRYDCEYSIDYPAPYTSSMSVILTRNPADSVCGFSYYLNDKADATYFALYTGDAYCSPNTGWRTKKDYPVSFLDKHDGNVPVVKSSVFYEASLVELEKRIRLRLNDPNTTVVSKPDSLIEGILCWHVQFVTTYYSMDLCLDKKTCYPVRYQVVAQAPTFVQTRTFRFKHVDGNASVPLSAYTESMLPKDWKSKLQTEKQRPDWLGKMAPDWQLPVLGTDKTVRLSALRGKVVVLDMTATWCYHCIEAAEVMNRLHEAFKDSTSVQLYSIFCSDVDSKPMIERFVQAHSIAVPVLYQAAEVGKSYRVVGYPLFLVVGANGGVVFQQEGFSIDVEQKIKGLLN
jgi:thiol-disulfide isomerase/thioredoxin